MMILRTVSEASLIATIGRRHSPSHFLRSFSNVTSPSGLISVPSGGIASVEAEGAELAVSSVAKVVAEPTLLQPRVVVYDGVCHLCHNGVRWVIKTDKDEKIKFCCLQSKAAEPYLKVSGLDREDVLRRFLFIEGPGQYHQGSTAALKVISHLPLPYSALSALLIVPTPLRDAVYDYVAKKRYNWFGKGNKCLVLQDKELLERFIDREEILDSEKSDEE